MSVRLVYPAVALVVAVLCSLRPAQRTFDAHDHSPEWLTAAQPDHSSRATGVNRPTHWATPLEREGLPNLHRVAPGLYRGAQPTAYGMQELKKMGIKTVVNLRLLHSDRDEIGETGLGYEHIYFNTFNAEEKEAVRFLQIVTDPDRQPVFVHCLHGADRTGTMCAIYRIAVEDWEKESAIDEMIEGGYGHHSIFRNLPRYLRELNVEDIKHRAGMLTSEKATAQ